jgi:hypothetical protein
MGKTAPSLEKKRSRKRRTVQISGWGRPQLKAMLAQIALTEGISFSQTVISLLEESVLAKLHRQKETFSEPLLRKLIREELRPLQHTLAEFHGRELFETGQMRWLLVNQLFWQVLPPTEQMTEKRLYDLLDTARKETLASINQWNHMIVEAVQIIRKRLVPEEGAA